MKSPTSAAAAAAAGLLVHGSCLGFIVFVTVIQNFILHNWLASIFLHDVYQRNHQFLLLQLQTFSLNVVQFKRIN